ncbi:leucine-rich repeat and IQ domain-containing protein 1 [Perognathus longimembris pacificus]|uniref:leucine-rich repeat and IQ domain-containing protein 1 n=1 Tax=Perognathus longimembris pacificus TaxID=214514 RepID=UPI002019B5BA|nr:leucine-rich repeat and IQ domain-containing protein 1 [Perognathus longimembris pacificus]
MIEEDDDLKLKEEIEAELDKISISTLENYEIESESKSESLSDDSDTGLDELPESVLHCINIIKKKSKTAEELILQDVEDSNALSCSYGPVSNNHMHFRLGSSSESKENSEQLVKMLAEIEKEEFLRSKTHCSSLDTVSEPEPCDLSLDEQVLPDDADISFGYFEVEEKCKQSFEAWQDKQKELENKENETLQAQRDRDKRQFEEDEEKRHCWLEQFEIEKRKLENIQKEEQDKMNYELQEEEKMWKEKFKQHEEFIRNLHLQMEEERMKFNEFQEKEKKRLLKLQHSAAVKIQAAYKALVTYQKYNPVIKRQIENKKRKAQESKEREANIRKREEERRKKLEEKQKVEKEMKRQKEEARKRREKEYEDKKNILRQKREELNSQEQVRLKEDAGQRLIVSSALKTGKCETRHLLVADMSKNKGDVVKQPMESQPENREDASLWLDKQSNKRENVNSDLILKESTQLQSNQANFVELNMEEKHKNLLKHPSLEISAREEIKYENMDKTEFDNSDLKENVNEQFQLQELKSQTQKEDDSANENIGQKIQVSGHRQEMNEVKSNEAQGFIKDNQQERIQGRENEEIAKQNEMKNNGTQEIIKDDQQEMVQGIEKEEVREQNVSHYDENSMSTLSMKQYKLSQNLEISEAVEENIRLQETGTDLSSEKTEQIFKNNRLNSGIVVINTTDTQVDTESDINKQDFVLDTQATCEDLSGYNATAFLAAKEVNTLNFQIKEIAEECQEKRSECESTTTCSITESTFLCAVEEKRLCWIKSFKPWFDIFKQNLEKKLIKRRRLVKCPVNMMPPLNTLEILQCGPWHTLPQVTTVTFQDLPGCSLSTLAECINLQFLSLRRCGLISLHSLTNCKKLKYIDAQENHIETINLENLDNLCVVLLNKNQLTSFHGLDGCTNIRNLELSHNKITRIGGLESLKNLQQLIMDHNQLISTRGLCDTPTIIHLDCSYNHLTDVEGIENCGLLQILKLQGNYLSELPSLRNHVLLRELHLDDNSISTVEAFSSYWLPLLQNLTLSQNSLTKIVPLFHFVSLEKLDVSNNCLSDLTSVKQWFDRCYSLCELSLTGNPLLQETNWRQTLLKILPTLRILNGDMLTSCSEIPSVEHHQLESMCFLDLCQRQIQELTSLTENCITGNRDIFTWDAAEQLCLSFNKLMALSNEFRGEHEHGDVNVTKRDKSETPPCHPTLLNSDRTLSQSHANEHQAEALESPKKLIDIYSSHSASSFSFLGENMERKNKERFIDQKREDSKIDSIATKKIPLMETVMKKSLLSNHQNIEQDSKITAAVIIQAHWRGYITRREIHFSTKLHCAATVPQRNSFISNQAVLKKRQKENIITLQEQREKAALRIQAVWKGFILRKKLTTALEAIENEESEEDYEEIDLGDFTFDEAALEKEWLAADSTHFPSQTLLLPNQLHWPKNSGALKYDDSSLNFPSYPAEAWLCNEKENVFSLEHTHLNTKSENTSLSWTPESRLTRKSLLKSEKEEKISEEWGFKEISTAQQMLKRAQKMKSKKVKKKLDPTLRLALFKNSENKVSARKSLKKSQPHRESYFEVLQTGKSAIKVTVHSISGPDFLPAKEEDLTHKDTSANERLERRREYTSQWLHTQVGIHGTTSSRNMKCNHFLPELDPDVLNGGRVQLVARLVSREDTDLDLFSMTSGSALSVKREKKSQAHKHSAGSSSHSIKGVCAPVITNTRPSKRERISFRDNPVQLSGGWGGGKKKSKTSK